MYLEYYGLGEAPFNVTPDPKFLFFTEQHQTALNHLQFAIRQRKGFVVLTGEVGTGKTTLCRKLLDAVGSECRTALILNPMLSPTQLLRGIIQEFGVTPPSRDRLACTSALNAFLLATADAGQEAVLIIDEAQDMSQAALEFTRLLSNLETSSRKLLQIVLAGQPELRHKLSLPSLRQLDQRITVRYHLRPMNVAETGQYLQHRLNIAGSGSGLCFDESAVTEIHRFTGGTPRLINALSDKALLAGYVQGTNRIDQNIVQMAIRDLQEVAA